MPVVAYLFIVCLLNVVVGNVHYLRDILVDDLFAKLYSFTYTFRYGNIMFKLLKLAVLFLNSSVLLTKSVTPLFISVIASDLCQCMIKPCS